MSRALWQEPEYRLHLESTEITLERAGVVQGSVPLDAADLPDALRGLLAGAAKARGRMTAVLPAAEVWHASLEFRARSTVNQRLEARQAASAALKLPPEALCIALGTPDAEGRTPVAAVSRETLDETRAFLARAGLAPAAIMAAGDFPGFTAPPLFWSAAPGLPMPTPRMAALAATAAGAALLIGVALFGGPDRTTEPATAASLPAAIDAAPSPQLAAAATLAPGGPEDLAVPRPRPAPAIRVATAERKIAHGAPRAPATPAQPDATALQPLLTLASRSLPDGLVLPARAAAEATGQQVAELTPQPRQSVAPQAALGAAQAARPTPVTASDGLRPLRRPGAAAVAAQPAAPQALPAAAAAANSSGRPRRRPADPDATTLAVAIDAAVATASTAAPVRVAALAPAPAAAASLAAASLSAATPPAPRRLAARPVAQAPKAAVVKAPAPVRQVRVQPAPVQQARVQAAPVQQARLQPVPTRQVRKQQAAPVQQARATPAPAATPRNTQASTQARRQPAATAPASQQVGISRNAVSLIGVFGSNSARHALLRLPNGTTKSVRTGDAFQGIQVTSVGADSVSLRGRGRDTVLTLPD